MDCNSRCCTLVILVALFATCFCNNKRNCLGSNTEGFTEPAGDIVREYGQPIDINCTIYPSSKYNSSSLAFFGLGAEIEPQYLTIINSTTLRYYREKPPAQNGMYKCKVKISEKDYSGICINNVVIGYKPQPVNDFKCVSHNWNDLVCSWVPPHNYVKTNYSLAYKPSNKLELSCPVEASQTPNLCFFNATTIPVYRQSLKFYKLVLIGSNQLGVNRWIFNVSHFSVVIPDKPRNVTEVATSADSISLKWYIPFGLEHFPPGVIHSVSYKTIFDDDWTLVNTSSLCVKARDKSCSTVFNLSITDLKYPNTYYNVSIKCRSGKDDAYPYRWSAPANISIRTAPTIPLSPPSTVIGSFEIVSTDPRGFRNINLYWRDILKQEENGDNFSYKIDSVEEDGIVKDILPSVVSNYSATFQNLTNNQYKFKIFSHNIVGSSLGYSEIIVPAKKDIPTPPDLVTRTPYGNRIYEISWEKSYHLPNIDNYTVFWCKNKVKSVEDDKSWFNQCGDLNWTIVNKDVNAVNITSFSDGEGYYGVASNSQKGSSGIVWASCIILPGRGGAEMRPPEVNHLGSNFLYLSWKLECSNRFGVVSGFLIEYCLSDVCSENSTCASPNPKLVSGTERFYNITNLKPYSTYAVFISVISKSKPNLKSRASCASTSEGVPGMITSVDVVDITNSTVTVTWTPPEVINGKLLRYLVQWGDNSKNVTDNTVIIENVESFRAYNIVLSACTSTGCGAPSPVKSVVTLMGRPGVPTNADVKLVNASAAKVYWTIPETTAGNLTYYTVEFEVYSEKKQATEFFAELNSTGLEAVLPWKECVNDGFTKYKVRVRATNAFKNGSNGLIGDWSDPVEGLCSLTENAPHTHLAVIIPLIAVLLSLLLCIFCGVFSQHLWVKFNQMRDIGVKLPARLGKRQEDKAENHVWNNHIARDTDTSVYRPSPDEQSLLKVKEEMELVQEDISNDRNSYGCDIIQSSSICGTPDSPALEPDSPPITVPSPGYIRVSQPAAGYVTIPPLASGYIMATAPPSSNVISPLPHCSVGILKQNGFSSIGPKPCNTYPEPNNLFGDMVSPINST